MSVAAIVQDISNFRDENGLVQPSEGKSNNGLMYTSEAMAILFALRRESAENYANKLLIELIMALHEAVYQCEGEMGQFFRHKDKSGGVQSFDDLIGVAAVDPHHASDILYFLRKNWGFYPSTPNPHPRFSKGWFKQKGQEFLWRSPAFRAHLKISAHHSLWRIGPIEWLAWVWEMMTNKRDQDGWRKTFFYAWAVADRYRSSEYPWVNEKSCPWLLRLIILDWSKSLHCAHSEGIGEVRGEYFGHSHPNAKFAHFSEEFILKQVSR